MSVRSHSTLTRCFKVEKGLEIDDDDGDDDESADEDDEELEPEDAANGLVLDEAEESDEEEDEVRTACTPPLPQIACTNPTATARKCCVLIRLHQDESEEEDEDEEECEETALRPTSRQIAKIKQLAAAKRQELNSDEDTAFDENGVDSDDEGEDEVAEQKDDVADEEDEDSESEEEAAAASAGGASAKRSWTCSACGHDNLTSGNPITATVPPVAATVHSIVVL